MNWSRERVNYAIGCSTIMSITSKINKLVREALPKGKPARIIWRRSPVRKSETLRVVTPAWKTLPKDERIANLKRAIEPHLSPSERAHIFRISVLTPREFKRVAELVPKHFLYGNTRSNGSRLPSGQFTNPKLSCEGQLVP